VEVAAPSSVNESEPVSMSAEASSDPDGDSLTFAWEQTDTGSHRVNLGGASTAIATFTAPATSGNVSLEFQVQVRDSKGGLASRSVSILVSGTNEEPVATADEITVLEDSNTT